MKLSAGGRPGTIHVRVYLGAGVDQELAAHTCVLTMGALCLTVLPRW